MYHVEKVFRLNKVPIFVCNIVLAIIMVFLAKPIGNVVSAINIFEASSYKYLGNIVISSDSVKNSYYANIGYISFSTMMGSYLICDNLMEREKTFYGGNYLTKSNGAELEQPDLAKGECAISTNLSLTYNIRVNDKIKARINFEDYIITVKYIFESYYGLKEIDIFNDIGLVVLGYNEEILDDAVTYDMVQFAEESVFFINEDIFVKDNVLFDLKAIFCGFCAFMLVIVLVTGFVLEYFFSDDIKNDVFALRRIGLSKTRVLKYNFLDAFYKYLTIYVIPIMVLVVYALVVGIDCKNEVITLLVYFCIVILFSVIRTQRWLRRK